MFKGENVFISSYVNKEAKNTTYIAVIEELALIAGGQYKLQVERIRQLILNGQDAEAKTIKSTLPVVTFGGTFDGAHRSENLNTYSNLMVIDVDGLSRDEITFKKNSIFQDEHVYAVWLSPSGLGLKILFSTSATPHTHKSYFGEICNYLLNNYGIEVDKSGSDICRLCFTSYDPEILIKKSYSPFEIDVEEIVKALIPQKKQIDGQPLQLNITDDKIERFLYYATEGRNLRSDRATIDKIIRFLKSKGLSITSSYEDWYKVGLAIANTFTFELGQKYFIYLCRLDGAEHDEYKSLSLLQYCYRNRKPKKVNFATIIYMAEQKGFLAVH